MKHATVELIPWTHDSGRHTMEEILTYIRTLPRNSAIGLEMSQEILNHIEKWNWPRPLRPDMLSAIEIVYECRKRNIRIFPIEIQRIKDLKRVTNGIGFLEGQRARERGFLTLISRALREVKTPTFPVFSGGTHIYEEEELLRRSKIPVNVKTDIFSDPEREKQVMSLYYEINKLEQEFFTKGPDPARNILIIGITNKIQKLMSEERKRGSTAYSRIRRLKLQERAFWNRIMSRRDKRTRRRGSK